MVSSAIRSAAKPATSLTFGLSRTVKTGPAQTKRVVRARWSIRGCEDSENMGAQGLENYAGASQR
eukprot:6940008-Alexandrium_andersonii.AAC.1